MSGPIERWIKTHEQEQGPYAALAGFEEDIRKAGGRLAEAYNRLDVYEQISLFGFVCGLLEEYEDGK